MHSMHNAKLDIPRLPHAAQIGHIVPALSNTPLLSIRQFCDAGCQVAFMATTINISYHNQLVLQGPVCHILIFGNWTSSYLCTCPCSTAILPKKKLSV